MKNYKFAILGVAIILFLTAAAFAQDKARW